MGPRREEEETGRGVLHRLQPGSPLLQPGSRWRLLQQGLSAASATFLVLQADLRDNRLLDDRS
jgi:hypothetical protein